MTTATLQALRASDSAHWYTRDGKPMHDVPGRNGELRKTNLRDAKKLGLLPSVTSILNIVAKPDLDAWKQSAYLRAALTMPLPDGVGIEEHAAAVAEVAQAEMSAGAQLGTLHHGYIERLVDWLEGYAESEPERPEQVPAATGAAFVDWYREQGLKAEAVELVITSPLGYAGTVDWLGTRPSGRLLIDWKTTKSEPGRAMKGWPSYGAQLVAYAEALGLEPDVWLVNVMISTTEPGRIETVDWTPRRWEMWTAFESAFALWCGPLGKGWSPLEAER